MVGLTVTVLATLSMAMVLVTNASHRNSEASKREVAALYAAEAGVTLAVFDLEQGGTGTLGGAGAPMVYDESVYWVEATDLGNGLTSLVSTGVDNDAGYRVEVVVEDTSSGMFRWGAFGDDQMTLDSNARTDSYDSSAGSYASQMVNKSKGKKYGKAGGHVGSNGGISLDSNAAVFGDAVPGPSSSVNTKGNSTVSGATTPAPEPVPLAPINLPAIPMSGSWNVGGSKSLPSGDHGYKSLTIDSNSKLTVTGPATLAIQNLVVDSNGEFIVDASGGPVEIYVTDDFVLNSNAIMASKTYTPSDISVYLLSNNIKGSDTVDFDSNSQLYGTLYAPDALVEINSNFELFGAAMAKRVHLDSNSQIHFDEALLNGAGGNPELEAVLWRARAFQPDRSASEYRALLNTKP